MYVKGDRHGPGLETTRHGVYEGMYSRGKRQGVGKYVTSHNWTYRGKWKNGHREGEGVLTSPMGHRFHGTWEDDHLPKGVLTGRFVGQYEGRFKATGCARRACHLHTCHMRMPYAHMHMPNAHMHACTHAHMHMHIACTHALAHAMRAGSPYCVCACLLAARLCLVLG